MLPMLKRGVLRFLMKRLSGKPGRGAPHKSVEIIHLWQFGGVGDMLLATPVVRALAQAYPDADIHLWCSAPSFADFLERFPSVKKIHHLPIYQFDSRTLLRGSVRHALCAVRDEMRSMPADLIVNLHIPDLLDWWAVEWWLLRQLQAPCSIGFDPGFIKHGSVYTFSLKALERRDIHYTVLYRCLLAVAGIACDVRTEFPLFDTDRARAAGLLGKQRHVAGQRRICIQIGGRRSRLEARMWPLDSFARLASRLIDHGIMPILIGVNEERSEGDELCRRVPECVNLIGCTQLGDMAALIAMSDVFIGHDSGPFHVAMAVGTPSVVIYGRLPQYINYKSDRVFVLTAENPLSEQMETVFERMLQMMQKSEALKPSPAST